MDGPPLVKHPFLGDISFAQIVQSIVERNRMMARTRRSRRSYGAGEWGRNRVRVFPDAKTGLIGGLQRVNRLQGRAAASHVPPPLHLTSTTK